MDVVLESQFILVLKAMRNMDFFVIVNVKEDTKAWMVIASRIVQKTGMMMVCFVISHQHWIEMEAIWKKLCARKSIRKNANKTMGCYGMKNAPETIMLLVAAVVFQTALRKWRMSEFHVIRIFNQMKVLIFSAVIKKNLMLAYATQNAKNQP
jgi:hypothetical protein